MSELFDKSGSEFDPTERDVREVVCHYKSYHPRYQFKPRGHKSGDYEMILEALKYNSMETCKLAIDGLHLSDHHKGKYEGIQYAFRENNIISFAENAEREDKARHSRVNTQKIKLDEDRKREKDKKEMLEMGKEGISLRQSFRRALRERTN